MNTNELMMVAWVPGPWEIALILVVVLVLFGGKKLPELAKGVAKGIKGFKAEMRDVTDAIHSDPDADGHTDTDAHTHTDTDDAHASADEKTPSGDDEPKA
jgi:sec-independent protein translocase protein TatA